MRSKLTTGTNAARTMPINRPTAITRRRAAVLLAAAVAVGLMAAGAAPADHGMHLQLDASVPAADQVVSRSPEKIVLDFSQKPEMAISRVTVTGPHGEAKLGKVAYQEDDETILFAPIEEPLVAGSYAVSWVTSSADLHPVRGEFAFTVAAAR